MIRVKWLLLVLFILLCLSGSWIWWVAPTPVDMSKYAPANTLLYLETNEPLQVVQTLARTDTWRRLDKISGEPDTPEPKSWIQSFLRWTGIGPIQSVILARAQLAIVITEVATTEEGDTLRIKPEGAAIIETHTASWRIRPPVEQALQKLAEITYGRPSVRRATIDGVEFIEWTAPEGPRQIVAAIIGSIVIVGNSEHAVQNCLAVYLQRQPSLNEDAELGRVRLQVEADKSLSFGFVPAAKSARLLGIGAQLMLGRTARDSQFQRLITESAAKVFGSVGWSSQAYLTGIEDRYFISLHPSVRDRLTPNFVLSTSASITQGILPDNVYSVTYYNFENPAQTWQSLKTAVSSQIDALSAVVFSSLLRSALLTYGIEEPERFLETVSSQILTIRLDESGERSVLVAKIRDETLLRDFVINRMLKNPRSERHGRTEILQDSRGQVGVAFTNEFVVTGAPLVVQEYVASIDAEVSKTEEPNRLTFFAPLPTSGNIVSYTNDSERLRAFMAAVISARGRKTVPPVTLENIINELPYSATITTLNERGLQRITRSPLGQFSVLLPLLLPDSRASSNTTEAK